ncbi:unnamed protein product, partial [Iphiclides podalirius]
METALYWLHVGTKRAQAAAGKRKRAHNRTRPPTAAGVTLLESEAASPQSIGAPSPPPRPLLASPHPRTTGSRFMNWAYVECGVYETVWTRRRLAANGRRKTLTLKELDTEAGAWGA